MQKILVWDWPVRIGHWLMVGGFVLGIVHRRYGLGSGSGLRGFLGHIVLVQFGSVASSSPMRRSIIDSPRDQNFGSRASSPKGLSSSE